MKPPTKRTKIGRDKVRHLVTMATDINPRDMCMPAFPHRNPNLYGGGPLCVPGPFSSPVAFDRLFGRQKGCNWGYDQGWGRVMIRDGAGS